MLKLQQQTVGIGSKLQSLSVLPELLALLLPFSHHRSLTSTMKYIVRCLKLALLPQPSAVLQFMNRFHSIFYILN